MGTAERMRKLYNSFEDYDVTITERGWRGPIEVAQAILKYGRPHDDANILDVGCGTGLVGLELRRNGFIGNLNGLDVADERLREARARTFRKKRVYDMTRRGDAYALPWDMPLFDGIVSGGLLALVGPRALNEMLRVLREGYVAAFTLGYIKEHRTSWNNYRAVNRRINRLAEGRRVEILEHCSLGTGYDNPDYAEEMHHLVVLRKLGKTE